MLTASKQPASSASVHSLEPEPYFTTETLIAFDEQH